jgi:signal transduction histidine kinase
VLVAGFALTLVSGYGAALVRATSFGFGLLMLLYTAYFIWRERAQLGLWRAGLIVAGFATLLAASLHDLMIVAGVLSPQRMSLVLVGFTTLLVAYALVCVHYMIRTLDQAQASNLLLETRVTEKTLALAQSYTKLRNFELAQAQTRERERLLRDLHDGVGAQLMTALRGLERGALDKDGIAHALQDGLDDLRMLMDNADPNATLTDRLAAWRNRWDSRLATLGLQLHWHLSDDLDEVVLPGDTSLQLLRVVQEACTNVVKHAQASQIWLIALRTHMSAGPTLYIEVRDNGIGFDATQPKSNGRGQANMRFRAKQMGAHLTIEPVPPPDQGCCVKLWLPLSA